VWIAESVHPLRQGSEEGSLVVKDVEWKKNTPLRKIRRDIQEGDTGDQEEVALRVHVRLVRKGENRKGTIDNEVPAVSFLDRNLILSSPFASPRKTGIGSFASLVGVKSADQKD
jgi:hypothetical protein